MSPFSVLSLLIRCAGRTLLRQFAEGEKDRRALAGCRLGPHPTVMATYHTGDGCQTDTGAPKVFVVVQTMKWPEQLVGKVHVETLAVVANKIYGFVVHESCADGNLNTGPFAGKLSGIIQQIFQHDLQ